MNKIKLGDACNLHPNKWLVMVRLEWAENGNNVVIGEIHSVCDTQDEARIILRSLPPVMGKTMIEEGFNATPQIGGIF